MMRRKQKEERDPCGFVKLWERDGEGSQPLASGVVSVTVEFLEFILDTQTENQYGYIDLNIALWENDGDSENSPDLSGKLEVMKPKKKKKSTTSRRRPVDDDEDDEEPVRTKRRR